MRVVVFHALDGEDGVGVGDGGGGVGGEGEVFGEEGGHVGEGFGGGLVPEGTGFEFKEDCCWVKKGV